MPFFSKEPKEEPKDLKEVLAQFRSLKADFESIKKELNDIKGQGQFCIQKIGMVRFNPFNETGGDQSFSLALLDKNSSGVVITSLYSREESRVYGKPIKDGLSEYTLSDEEKRAIEEAKQS